jgi:putative transposase
MIRKGDCYDNSVAESFETKGFYPFATKVERVYHRRYGTIQIASSDLFQYIEVFYNRNRLHSYLNFTNP